MTNRDRLRDMTDEELAEFIGECATDCGVCPVVESCAFEANCVGTIIKWLKAKVET